MNLQNHKWNCTGGKWVRHLEGNTSKLLQKSQTEINHISVLCIKLYLKSFNFQIRMYKLKKSEKMEAEKNCEVWLRSLVGRSVRLGGTGSSPVGAFMTQFFQASPLNSNSLLTLYRTACNQQKVKIWVIFQLLFLS